jgi:diadenosine tetraphosphate (Ap4A) HIT family hydrolase
VTEKVHGCVLCDGPGGRVVRTAARWRVVHVTEPGFPAYYRVIWHTHLPEFTQLSRDERIECLDVVAAIEQAMLRELQPAKVNLASFGNRVAHLHWHVIGRFAWDSHYPEAVWGAKQREASPDRLADIAQRLSGLEARLLVELQRFT